MSGFELSAVEFTTAPPAELRKPIAGRQWPRLFILFCHRDRVAI
jgi:hypothetical protein